LLRALAPAGLVLLLATATDWVYFSLARGGQFMRWSALESILTAAGFVLGLHFGGALGVALAFSIVRGALWPFSVAYCFAGTFLRPGDLWSAAWRPLTAAGLAAAVTVACEQSWMTGWLPVGALAACGALFSAVYGGVMLTLPGGRRIVREMLSLSRELRGSGILPAANSRT